MLSTTAITQTHAGYSLSQVPGNSSARTIWRPWHAFRGTSILFLHIRNSQHVFRWCKDYVSYLKTKSDYQREVRSSARLSLPPDLSVIANALSRAAVNLPLPPDDNSDCQTLSGAGVHPLLPPDLMPKAGRKLNSYSTHVPDRNDVNARFPGYDVLFTLLFQGKSLGW